MVKANTARKLSSWYIASNQHLSEYTNKICNYSADKYASNSQKVLIRLAKSDFDKKIVDTFIYRLDHLNLLQKELINTASISNSNHTITIISSFGISEQQRERLTTAIQKKIAAEAKIIFQQEKGCAYGIELRDRGYKIFWNLKYYITYLETTMAS